ncbi:GDP-fucose protein O-fucosyltransferase [Cynara cardunculus var. scolymus]|uniref:O-fucosyltransferase family protein n=1 Tax=Cynara cardunculus var. scolymus TaxID=59895 RepID=A0A103XEV1_CYNCS|nr:GDP-fucose protein O-fucosyltransferase [Cynara cardunculus var. scolymus]
MGKQGSKQGDLSSPFASFQYQFRYQKMVQGSDPTAGKKFELLHGLRSNSMKFGSFKGAYVGKRHTWIRKHFSSIVFTVALMGFLFLLDSFLGSIFEPSVLESSPTPAKLSSERELKQDESKFWEESYRQASVWSPCADRKELISAEKLQSNNGYILVSANGGLNQQRVAVCNAVAVASLLNATLVIPRFLYSNDEVNIVKDLPPHLKSLDFKEMGSLITDSDISKEATPAEYIEKILPLLSKNGVVHFLGYGNRLGFDPLPSELQRLRCKCNYHALKFVPKIQEIGSLLIRRIRNYDGPRNKLDKRLLGNFITDGRLNGNDMDRRPLKYLALHLRFEVDMVAYSLCNFGGGQVEKAELQAYREDHFPLLMQRLKKSKPVSAEELRSSGRCPLTPEEAALVLAALGFTSDTYIYLAGSQIYGGESRMSPLTNLYPRLITKEDLLSPSEIAPFKNLSSQRTYEENVEDALSNKVPEFSLDFIACATADVFAITDSGSQLSSLVSGFRTYYGGGHSPTLRPSKKRLADILSTNQTIRWTDFEARVTKMITESQTVRMRGWGRSIYRQPRCPECMCKFQ